MRVWCVVFINSSRFARFNGLSENGTQGNPSDTGLGTICSVFQILCLALDSRNKAPVLEAAIREKSFPQSRKAR